MRGGARRGGGVARSLGPAGPVGGPSSGEGPARVARPVHRAHPDDESAGHLGRRTRRRDGVHHAATHDPRLVRDATAQANRERAAACAADNIP